MSVLGWLIVLPLVAMISLIIIPKKNVVFIKVFSLGVSLLKFSNIFRMSPINQNISFLMWLIKSIFIGPIKRNFVGVKLLQQQLTL